MKKVLKFLAGAAAVAVVVCGVLYFVKKVLCAQEDEFEGFDDEDDFDEYFEDEDEEDREYVTLDIDEEESVDGGQPEEEDADSVEAAAE